MARFPAFHHACVAFLACVIVKTLTHTTFIKTNFKSGLFAISKWTHFSFETSSILSALVMAIEEASIDAAERTWQDYELSRITLGMK